MGPGCSGPHKKNDLPFGGGFPNHTHANISKWVSGPPQNELPFWGFPCSTYGTHPLHTTVRTQSPPARRLACEENTSPLSISAMAAMRYLRTGDGERGTMATVGLLVGGHPFPVGLKENHENPKGTPTVCMLV